MESGTFEKSSAINGRKKRITKMVTSVVATVVVIAALVGSVAVVSGRLQRAGNSDRSFDMNKLSRQMRTVIAGYHNTNIDTTREKRQSGYTTCESELNNETVPAAHIEGYRKWRKVASVDSTTGVYIPGYVTSWRCIGNNGGPFVDGGMVFDHTQKALIVPTCGYYYISSSITFSLPTKGDVFHKLRITRECSSSGGRRHQLEVIGYASAAKDYSQVTSHVEEVMLLCEGSKVQVIVPDTVPCCATGSGSYINAFMVAESNCTVAHARDHAMTIY